MSAPMHRRMAGLSLIELMIAMVLGLIVMGAAFAVFMSNRNTFSANEGINRIQESARVAFELMSRDIRAAGGTACSNVSVVETVVGTETETQAFVNEPVNGTADTLTVLSGDDTAYRIIASTPTSVTLDPDQVDDATEVFSVDDLLLLCNARKTFLVEATSVDTTTVGFPQLPGSYDPMDDEFGPPAAVVLARFRDVNWSVGANTRGGSSLWVTRGGGTPEEVAEGITDLDFEYLEQGGGAYTTAPVWANVVAVRITMTLQGADIDGQQLTRTASNVVSMRSRTL